MFRFLFVGFIVGGVPRLFELRFFVARDSIKANENKKLFFLLGTLWEKRMLNNQNTCLVN